MHKKVQYTFEQKKADLLKALSKALGSAQRLFHSFSFSWFRGLLEACRETILHVCSLETPVSFYNSRMEHGMETQLTSIDFSRWGTEALNCKFLVNNLSIVPPHTLGILTANVTCGINFIELLISLKWMLVWYNIRSNYIHLQNMPTHERKPG